MFPLRVTLQAGCKLETKQADTKIKGQGLSEPLASVLSQKFFYSVALMIKMLFSSSLHTCLLLLFSPAVVLPVYEITWMMLEYFLHYGGGNSSYITVYLAHQFPYSK